MQAKVELRGRRPITESKIEARFTGPDPIVLRQLGAEATSIMREDPVSDAVMHNWRERTKLVRPQFVESQARELGVDKRDMDSMLKMNFSGLSVGLYRDGTRMLPIVARTPAEERLDAPALAELLRWCNGRGTYVPIEPGVGGCGTANAP